MKTSKNFWFFSEALPPQPLSSKEILSSLFNPPLAKNPPVTNGIILQQYDYGEDRCKNL
ncbi:MAG: hypothetical protein ACK2TT_09725 [Anaerolineales bacterium]|jgi:hypothetical protein